MASVLLNDRLDVVSVIEAERNLETAVAAAASMMVFNNGYVTIMDNSSMRDTNLLQMPTMHQPAISNHYPLELQATDATNACRDNMVALTFSHMHSVVLPSANTENHSLYYFVSSAFEVASTYSYSYMYKYSYKPLYSCNWLYDIASYNLSIIMLVHAWFKTLKTALCSGPKLLG